MSAILVTLNRNISGSKMNIQEWFSPQDRASNPLKIRYFPPRIPFPVLGHINSICLIGAVIQLLQN